MLPKLNLLLLGVLTLAFRLGSRQSRLVGFRRQLLLLDQRRLTRLIRLQFRHLSRRTLPIGRVCRRERFSFGRLGRSALSFSNGTLLRFFLGPNSRGFGLFLSAFKRFVSNSSRSRRIATTRASSALTTASRAIVITGFCPGFCDWY